MTTKQFLPTYARLIVAGAIAWSASSCTTGRVGVSSANGPADPAVVEDEVPATDPAKDKDKDKDKETPPKDTPTPQVVATLNGAPTGSSGATTLDVTVGGTDVTQYRYDLVNGTSCATATYGAWTKVAIHITEAVGADGAKILCVLGRNKALKEQGSATSATWTKDTTDPTATLSGAPTGFSSALNVDVTVAGASIVEYRYDLVSGNDCTTGTYGPWTPVATHITEVIGADGAKILCVLGRDAALNAQATPTSASWTKDTVAPTSTLSGAPTSPSSATTLDVTVAGAGVAEYQYDLVSGTDCTSASYGAWTPIATHITEAPGANGNKILCVKGRDAALNAQATATTAAWLKDTAPPTVGAFAASTSVTGTGFTLNWTAGSDTVTAVGALEYFVCSGASAASIDTVSECLASTTEMSWTAATLTLAVSGKWPLTTYYVNVVVRDAAQNAAIYGGKTEATIIGETKITASDGVVSDSFGYNSMAVSGNMVVIGAPFSASIQGAAYVYRFDPSDNSWQETKLVASDGVASDYFGASAAVSGNTVVIGASGKGSNQGAAYVYRFDPSDASWQETTLTASDGVSGDSFGQSVAASGNTIVIGASGDASSQGAAYVYRFDPSDSSWQETKLTASDGAAGDLFGVSAVSGNTVVLGAPASSSTDQGAAYVYRFDPSDNLWKETKLTASDGAANDQFGSSAAVSGNTVVIGAFGGASFLGAAYVYRFDPSDNSWQEVKLTASDGTASDFFGTSAAVSGNTVVIGASGDASNRGAVYVYRFDPSDNSWQEVKLTASDGASGDYFGNSAAASGNTVVIGAYGDASSQGAAYVYEFEAVEPDGETNLTASDGAALDQFGRSSAISGNTVVIGASGDASNRGSAYVYRFDPSDHSWLEFKLTASDGAAFDQYGFSSAISGNTVVIGAINNVSAGSAYIYRFDPSDSSWQETKLNASDGSGFDQFGNSVAVSGNTVVIGAQNANSSQGSAYVYRFDPSNNSWPETKLTASDGAAGDTFGNSAAASGNTVVIGANNASTNQGAAYVYRFDPSDNSWLEFKLSASDGAAFDNFGNSTAVSGNTVVVGASGANTNQGAAYVYRFDPSDNLWQETKLTASDGATNDYFGESAAADGNIVVIGASYSNSAEGSAYIYRLDPSDNSWYETKLTASDAAASDYFGNSTAISGNTVVIAAHGRNSYQGAAYVYKVP